MKISPMSKGTTDMYRFLSEHRSVSVVTVFGGAAILTLIAAFFLGMSILSSAQCPEYPGDPCDAAPMLVMSLWIFSIPASLIVGIVAAGFTNYASHIYIK
jgi:hypothetical protein